MSKILKQQIATGREEYIKMMEEKRRQKSKTRLRKQKKFSRVPSSEQSLIDGMQINGESRRIKNGKVEFFNAKFQKWQLLKK